MLHPSTQSPEERAALSRLRQVLNAPGLLRANFVQMKRSCGTPTCRCAKAKRHWHLSWYINQSKNGKLRMKCVPRQQLEEVRQWVACYQEARQLLTTVGDIYWRRVGKRKQ